MPFQDCFCAVLCLFLWWFMLVPVVVLERFWRWDVGLPVPDESFVLHLPPLCPNPGEGM